MRYCPMEAPPFVFDRTFYFSRYVRNSRFVSRASFTSCRLMTDHRGELTWKMNNGNIKPVGCSYIIRNMSYYIYYFEVPNLESEYVACEIVPYRMSQQHGQVLRRGEGREQHHDQQQQQQRCYAYIYIQQRYNKNQQHIHNKRHREKEKDPPLDLGSSNERIRTPEHGPTKIPDSLASGNQCNKHHSSSPHA